MEYSRLVNNPNNLKITAELEKTNRMFYMHFKTVKKLLLVCQKNKNQWVGDYFKNTDPSLNNGKIKLHKEVVFTWNPNL